MRWTLPWRVGGTIHLAKCIEDVTKGGVFVVLENNIICWYLKFQIQLYTVSLLVHFSTFFVFCCVFLFFFHVFLFFFYSFLFLSPHCFVEGRLDCSPRTMYRGRDKGLYFFSFSRATQIAGSWSSRFNSNEGRWHDL